MHSIDYIIKAQYRPLVANTKNNSTVSKYNFNAFTLNFTEEGLGIPFVVTELIKKGFSYTITNHKEYHLGIRLYEDTNSTLNVIYKDWLAPEEYYTSSYINPNWELFKTYIKTVRMRYRTPPYLGSIVSLYLEHAIEIPGYIPYITVSNYDLINKRFTVSILNNNFYDANFIFIQESYYAPYSLIEAHQIQNRFVNNMYPGDSVNISGYFKDIEEPYEESEYTPVKVINILDTVSITYTAIYYDEQQPYVKVVIDPYNILPSNLKYNALYYNYTQPYVKVITDPYNINFPNMSYISAIYYDIQNKGKVIIQPYDMLEPWVNSSGIYYNNKEPYEKILSIPAYYINNAPIKYTALYYNFTQPYTKLDVDMYQIVDPIIYFTAVYYDIQEKEKIVIEPYDINHPNVYFEHMYYNVQEEYIKTPPVSASMNALSNIQQTAIYYDIQDKGKVIVQPYNMLEAYIKDSIIYYNNKEPYEKTLPIQAYYIVGLATHLTALYYKNTQPYEDILSAVEYIALSGFSNSAVYYDTQQIEGIEITPYVLNQISICNTAVYNQNIQSYNKIEPISAFMLASLHLQYTGAYYDISLGIAYPDEYEATATFNSAGGTPTYESQTDYIPHHVTNPGTPTKSGYLFDGWLPTLPQTITEDTTFVAQWRVPVKSWSSFSTIPSEWDVVIDLGIVQACPSISQARDILEDVNPASTQELGDRGVVRASFEGEEGGLPTVENCMERRFRVNEV